MVRRPSRPWPTEAWERAVSSGALNHMQPERARVFAHIYRAVEQIREREVAQGMAVPQLSGLSIDGPITSAERRRYLDTLGMLEDLDWRQNNRSRQLAGIAADAGLRLKVSRAKVLFDGVSKADGACIQPVDFPTRAG